LGPNDFFGEIGVLEHVPRTATVRTTSDSSILKIDGEDFLAALEMCSVMSGRVAGTVADRRAETDRLVRNEAS
jgi:CRP-like cAMP-binding protein